MVSHMQYKATWLYQTIDAASRPVLQYAKSASGELSNGCILKPQFVNEVVEIITDRYLETRIIALRLHWDTS
jgi:hypothetical protein